METMINVPITAVTMYTLDPDRSPVPSGIELIDGDDYRMVFWDELTEEQQRGVLAADAALDSRLGDLQLMMSTAVEEHYGAVVSTVTTANT